MSVGVRAREFAFVNGDRSFAARFVIDECVVIQERSANYFVVERSELTLCFERVQNPERIPIVHSARLHWLRGIESRRHGKR